MHGRRLSVFVVGVATALLAAVPAAFAGKPQDRAVVCNEAENSHRGGYVVTDGPVDPNPPAFLRGSQMKIGNGKGVENAAFRSPALRLCGPATPNDDPVIPDGCELAPELCDGDGDPGDGDPGDGDPGDGDPGDGDPGDGDPTGDEPPDVCVLFPHLCDGDPGDGGGDPGDGGGVIN